MKLSQMPTKQAAACMAELAVPIGNILKSETVKAWYEANKKATLNIITVLSLVPLLLRDQYDDAAAIAAALTGKAKAKIDEQPFSQTVSELSESIDKDLIVFFTSQLRKAQGK